MYYTSNMPRKSENNFAPEILERIPGLVVMYNILTGEYLFVNGSAEKILGYKPENFTIGGIAFAAGLMHPEDLPKIMEQNNQALALANAKDGSKHDADPIVGFEYRMRHRDGRWIWLFTEGTVFKRNGEGKVELVLNVSVDITKRKEREGAVIELSKELQNLKESEKSFKNFIEAVDDYAIFRLDTQGRVIGWNQGIFQIVGYAEDEILGQPISIFFPPEDVKNGKPEEELKRARERGKAVGEGVRRKKDGTPFYASVTTTAIFDTAGLLQGYSKIVRDITERREAEETIRFQALHDSLTGLANRKALDDHFTLSLSLATRNKYKLAILFLDIDRFKNINDTLGHGAGDLVLKEIAQRLQKTVRREDTVARLGGDEFIILLNNIHSPQDAIKAADKIMKGFGPAMRVHNQSLHVTTSMGIAMFPSDGQDIQTLLKNADTALYRAKDAGRNRYQFYNYSMNLQSEARLSLEEDLRAAITEQMELVYQPFINLKNGQVLGAEALIRWRHPRLGTLMPYDFIPLAEEVGMIIPIGNWVLRQVCEQGKKFQEQGRPLALAINLSARQFSEISFIPHVSQVLEETGFDPRLLEVEITESMAMENIERTNLKLEELSKVGISIAIDDFGTGHSSLSYLSRFPVNKLKIDKSFIRRGTVDSHNTAIIRAIISMGQSLNIKVCAEGVELEQQRSLLKSMGCDMIQGFLISKPLSVEDLDYWLSEYQKQKAT